MLSDESNKFKHFISTIMLTSFPYSFPSKYSHHSLLLLARNERTQCERCSSRVQIVFPKAHHHMKQRLQEHINEARPDRKHQETSSRSKVIIFLLGNMLGKLLLLLLPLTPLLCTLLLLVCVWWKPQGPDSFIVHVETKCYPGVKCHLRLIC